MQRQQTQRYQQQRRPSSSWFLFCLVCGSWYKQYILHHTREGCRRRTARKRRKLLPWVLSWKERYASVLRRQKQRRQRVHRIFISLCTATSSDGEAKHQRQSLFAPEEELPLYCGSWRPTVNIEVWDIFPQCISVQDFWKAAAHS